MLTTEGENLTVTPSCMTIVNEDNISYHKTDSKPQGNINQTKLRQIKSQGKMNPGIGQMRK